MEATGKNPMERALLAQQIKEVLLIRDYESACSLKDEIRARMAMREDDNLEFCGIQVKGGFLELLFQPINLLRT